ncbi:Uncharacterized protein YjbI, contains pentapeptide repeats [Nitrosomonas sp. Nm132]|nr:Uncharacterized protein YjbI, contains pentapeptide repeats [Nitrosomonas sp. Nm132]
MILCRDSKRPVYAVLREALPGGAALSALAREPQIKSFLNSLPKPCVSNGVTLILMFKRKIVSLSIIVKNLLCHRMTGLRSARVLAHPSDKPRILHAGRRTPRPSIIVFKSFLLLLLLIGAETFAQGARNVDGCSIRRGTFCVDMNLYGADLQSASLANSQFTRSVLSGANLTGANLNEANLSSAQLRGANLSQASLVKTNARGARFNDAQLVGANLRGAILQNADLSGANLTGSVLTNADLTNAKLGGAMLNNANLLGANMRAANLRGASLVNANLQGVDFTGVDLTDADLSGANLDQAIFTMVKTNGCKGCP